MIRIAALDHLVLTVADIAITSDFYARVLGMTPQRFTSGGIERFALSFGRQKFNLHRSGHVIDRNVRHATPGSADLCLLTETPIAAVVEHLRACGVLIIEGPVPRTGAIHPLMSVYFHDPDENLVEVSNEMGASTESTSPDSAEGRT